MAETTKPKTIFILDDEPQNMSWMIDYIEAAGYSIILNTNLNDALKSLSREIYRAAIIDLNVPVLQPLDEEMKNSGSKYLRYPGLYAARYARNVGYRDRQVIIYSVHQDAEVSEEARRLTCTYLLKGRPRAFKQELDGVLEFDPTTDS